MLKELKSLAIAIGRCARVIDPPGFRRIEVLRDGEWHETLLCRLNIGDRYRAYEPDGEPVLYDGHHELIVDSAPLPCVDNPTPGTWQVWALTP